MSKPMLGPDSFQRMRERTQATREAEAANLFSIENINKMLSEAAARGLSAVTFRPSRPMDIAESETAKAAKETLTKAGFLTEWRTNRPTDGEPDTVLRVSWGADALSNIQALKG